MVVDGVVWLVWVLLVDGDGWVVVVIGCCWQCGVVGVGGWSEWWFGGLVGGFVGGGVSAVAAVRGVLGVSWRVFVVGYGSNQGWFGGWSVAGVVQFYHGYVWCVLLGLGGSKC